MGQFQLDCLTPFIRLFSYFALFICLTIQMIHIELSENFLTDASFVHRRNFMNRRYVLILFRSDNRTNFVIAQQEIVLLYDFLDNPHLQSEYLKRNLNEFNR